MSTQVGLRATGGPRVLVLGQDTPGGLMHSYASAFRRIGAEVSTYCLARAFRAGLNPTLVRVAYRLGPATLLRRFNSRLLSDLGEKRIDLAFVLKGENISGATIGKLRRRTGAVWLNFYPDDPFTDVRSNRLAYGSHALGAYNHCFTFARHLIEQYRATGTDHVTWLPFARDPDLHSPTTCPTVPEFDAVFVGNLDADRVRWLEAVAAEFAIAIFGEHTQAAVPRSSALGRATFLPAAYGRALSGALARGAISLNVMRQQNRFSHNMRSFESLACGAFTLSQRTAELESLFREDMEVAFVDEPAALPERVAHWLPLTSQRRRIAAAGYERVRNDTYDHRALQIISTVTPSFLAV